MFDFPFDSAKYKKYKRSFIQQVMVALFFDKVEPNEQHKQAWFDYCLSNFNSSPSGNVMSNPIQISKKDGTLSFAFSNGMVGTRINAIAYSNFSDTIIPQVYKLRQFVDNVVGKDTKIRKIKIFKVNGWQVETKDFFKLLKEGLQAQFFSEEYLSYREHFVETNVENQLIVPKEHVWEENGNLFKISSGWLNVKDSPGVYRLLLNTEYLKLKKDGIALSDVESILTEMNSSLFDAFEWVVSDKVKEMMEME